MAANEMLDNWADNIGKDRKGDFPKVLVDFSVETAETVVPKTPDDSRRLKEKLRLYARLWGTEFNSEFFH